MVTCARCVGTLPKRLVGASVETTRNRNHLLTVPLVMAFTSPWRRNGSSGRMPECCRGGERLVFQNRRKDHGPGVNGPICALLETSEAEGKRRQPGGKQSTR